MRPNLLQPSLGLSIADETEQPSKESETVTATEPELRRMGSKGIRECARVVIGSTDSIDNHVGDGLRILVVEEEI
jgi:hypothetical protein